MTIDSGRASLDTSISVSSRCAGQAPSKLGFKPGQTIKARDAILALVTKSANDVACAIGEHISGTESAFARDMTNRARRLGMSKTTFRNASGLPDDGQVTTARDMATLGRALQGEAGLESFLRWSEQPLVKFAETALVLLLAAHLAGGLRLLALEFLAWRDWQKGLLALAAGFTLCAGLLFLLNV